MIDCLISVIMPAYNAAKYIGHAIESVILQSYPNWELVIVDDCSTDNTAEIVKSFQNADNQIIYHKLDNNTGSAYVPREIAAKLATGEYVLMLDADDYLEEKYLEKVSAKIKSTQADAILGKMYILDEVGNFSGNTIPRSEFDETQELTGIDALRNTVPWKIAFNGAAFRRSLFLKTLKDHEGYSKGVYGDELFCRHCVLNSNLVVFSRSKYYYRTNADSLIHTFSPRIFHLQDTCEEVRAFFITQFGSGSIEHQRAESYMFSGLEYCFGQYLRGRDTLNASQKREYLEKFKQWYDKIDFNLIHPQGKQEKLYAFGFKAYYLIRNVNFILRKWYHYLKRS